MTAFVDWVRGIPRSRGRSLGVTLFVAYWAFVLVRADSLGQLFNFTFIGLAEGAVFAVAASGVVLTYATTGVFNFGHGAVGMISAYVYYALTVQHDVPVLVGVVLVLLVFAPLVGFVMERVMRFFRDAPVQTTVVVTVAVTILCIGLAQKAWPPETAATLPRLFGANNQLRIWEATLTYDQVAALVLAVAVALLLRTLLFASRTGVAMRAVVDNANLAALNGAPPTTIARYSWILSSMLAAAAGILLASGTNLEPITLTFFVAAAYGAAVVGKLKSLPLTFAGAIALGLMKNHALVTLPQTDGWASFRLAIPGIFLFFALLLVPAAKLSVGRIVGRRAPAVPGLRASLVRGALFVGFVALLANLGPADRLADMTRAMIYALLLLSVVVLTGFSGQTSLCQYVFLAIGAWAMGKSFGGDSLAGMGLAGLAAVPLGVLVAIPALRLQGLYLALVTFGFAAVSRDLVLQNSRIYGKGNVAVGRLELLGLDFSGNKAFLILCTLVFVLAAVGILALKRGAFGRRLAAMRDSQAACVTLGLDVRRTKLAVFALSAFVAGVAGALFGGLGASAGTIQFEPINNIVLLLFAVVGGVTTMTGAVIGGTLFALLPLIQSEQPSQAGLVFAGIAVAAVALGRQPNGLAGMLFEWLRGVRTADRGRLVSRDGVEVAGAPA